MTEENHVKESGTVHMLLPVNGEAHTTPSIVGLYWPATGAVLLQGLFDDSQPLALTCSVRRWPLDAAGCTQLEPGLAVGSLLALTAAGEGPQALLSLLEVVPLDGAEAMREAG